MLAHAIFIIQCLYVSHCSILHLHALASQEQCNYLKGRESIQDIWQITKYSINAEWMDDYTTSFAFLLVAGIISDPYRTLNKHYLNVLKLLLKNSDQYDLMLD